MSITEDTRELNSYIDRKVDIHSVASFKGNEHIVRLKLKFDIKKIREALQEYGDSLVIAGSKTKTKIHIHTNNTLEVFNICKKNGILSGEKADDMWKQQKTKNTNSTIAIVTDSGADIPEDIDSVEGDNLISHSHVSIRETSPAIEAEPEVDVEEGDADRSLEAEASVIG